MLAALTGLLLGAWHVISGPDHLAAIAPLVSSRADGATKPWRTGFAWGLGHASGVTTVGLLLLAFGALLPLDSLGAWSERIVGALIIGVGAWGLWRVRHETHAHAHDVGTHSHGSTRERMPAFVIGTLHGLAGSSHLYGVLPALALGGSARVAYLIAFAIGSIGAMAGFSSLLAAILERLPGSRELVRRWALIVASVVAIAIGSTWLVLH